MAKGTIVYVGGFELPDKNAAAHRVLSNGKILKNLGYDIIFVGIDKKIEFNKFLPTTKTSVQGFESLSLPYPKTMKEWIKYLTSIDSLISILKGYTDIEALICYNYQSAAFMKLKRYCKKHKIKIIADCTEWYSTKGTNIIFKIIKGFDSFMRMRIIQKNLDGIIVISQYLEKYYSNSKNIIYLPPLVDTQEEKWATREQKIDTDDYIKIVYAGSPGLNKDKLDILIDALYELRNKCQFRFNILGMTKEQYLNSCSNELKLHDLYERVNFLGQKTHLESLEYVKNADYTMFIREDNRMTKAGFPTKFVESMTCGIPVITTKTSDLTNYLIEGKNGYFIDINKNMPSKLESIFQQEVKKINEMKIYCRKNNAFLYENYLEEMDQFMKKLYK